MKKLSAILITILLAACTQNNLAVDNSAKNKINTVNENHHNEKPKANYNPPQLKGLSLDEKTACENKGGKVIRGGLAGNELCVVEFNDKGKTCTDGHECQSGRCLDDRKQSLNNNNLNSDKITGICAKDNNPFGCYGLIKNGQATGFLCVD